MKSFEKLTLEVDLENSLGSLSEFHDAILGRDSSAIPFASPYVPTPYCKLPLLKHLSCWPRKLVYVMSRTGRLQYILRLLVFSFFNRVDALAVDRRIALRVILHKNRFLH